MYNRFRNARNTSRTCTELNRFPPPTCLANVMTSSHTRDVPANWHKLHIRNIVSKPLLLEPVQRQNRSRDVFRRNMLSRRWRAVSCALRCARSFGEIRIVPPSPFPKRLLLRLLLHLRQQLRTHENQHPLTTSTQNIYSLSLPFD